MLSTHTHSPRYKHNTWYRNNWRSVHPAWILSADCSISGWIGSCRGARSSFLWILLANVGLIYVMGVSRPAHLWQQLRSSLRCNPGYQVRRLNPHPTLPCILVRLTARTHPGDRQFHADQHHHPPSERSSQLRQPVHQDEWAHVRWCGL